MYNVTEGAELYKEWLLGEKIKMVSDIYLKRIRNLIETFEKHDNFYHLMKDDGLF